MNYKKEIDIILNEDIDWEYLNRREQNNDKINIQRFCFR